MNSLLASLVVVVVFGAVVQGAKYGEECSADSDCTGADSNFYCAKYSDCEKGRCLCKRTYYYDAPNTACKVVGSLVKKGESCDPTKASTDQMCDDEGGKPLHCAACGLATTGHKCLNAATVTSITTPLLLAPIVFKLFY